MGTVSRPVSAGFPRDSYFMRREKATPGNASVLPRYSGREELVSAITHGVGTGLGSLVEVPPAADALDEIGLAAAEKPELVALAVDRD